MGKIVYKPMVFVLIKNFATKKGQQYPNFSPLSAMFSDCFFPLSLINQRYHLGVIHKPCWLIFGHFWSPFPFGENFTNMDWTDWTFGKPPPLAMSHGLWLAHYQVSFEFFVCLTFQKFFKSKITRHFIWDKSQLWTSNIV